MSHILCPLCGKYAAISTLRPSDSDFDLKVVSFKSLGRGRGFAKGDEYSLLDDEVLSQVIAYRVEKLYNMFVDHGILTRIIDNSIISRLYELDELKKQSIRKDYKLSSLEQEAREKDHEIEEIELRSHVDYIILESLSLDQSARLRFDEERHYNGDNPEDDGTKPVSVFPDAGVTGSTEKDSSSTR